MKEIEVHNFRMDERIARCGCGRLRVRVRGEPLRVQACHCDFCQKRTGAVFQVSAHFKNNQIVGIDGESSVYNGLESDGVGTAIGNFGVSYHFCPTCGSTVYWTLERWPDLYGIAVGNFVDPGFPPPTRDVWTELRHDWIPPIPGAVAYEHFPDDL